MTQEVVATSCYDRNGLFAVEYFLISTRAESNDGPGRPGRLPGKPPCVGGSGSPPSPARDELRLHCIDEGQSADACFSSASLRLPQLRQDTYEEQSRKEGK